MMRITASFLPMTPGATTSPTRHPFWLKHRQPAEQRLFRLFTCLLESILDFVGFPTTFLSLSFAPVRALARSLMFVEVFKGQFRRMAFLADPRKPDENSTQTF